MKLEVGQFVRTKDGYIDKILDISEEWYCLGEDEEDKPYKIYKLSKYYYDEEFDEDNDWVLESFLTKASYNIIDLIEVGDYVNGERVAVIEEGIVKTGNEVCKTYIHNSWIKSIVTKEQFSQMEYKVGG